ncbi:hypothetical protein LQ042_09370 [Enterococcus faecium]|uniref:hypothetical protein n=1 Tax=Enterococcus faecium TaxID=1352 RepID=UPI00201B0986|nr:hypothetical protein [Enterococcus faecium]MCL4608348.1 hypothetical protein [Enterococcus faecium]MCL4613554.1 hypothetical protein [Enterococcus faecium]
MKKIIKIIFVGVLVSLFLVGCSSNSQEKKADYTTEQAEEALNNGESIDDKTVKITVDKLVPDSAFGYNIQTGEHLNFVSSENPNVKEGDSLVVKVTKVESTLGSFIITYTK